MEFNENKPIYIQIADNICDRILTGEFPAGARIPSVREWSGTIGVNPNTVVRSYDHLAGKGIIANQRGIGYSVCEDACAVILDTERKHFLEEELPAFLERAGKLGIDIHEHIK